MLLSIEKKLDFGKYAGKSPREVFMGSNVQLPRDVSDKAYNIVDKAFSEKFGIEWRSAIIQDSTSEFEAWLPLKEIKVCLSNDKSVGHTLKRLGHEDLRIYFPLDYFVFLARGDVGYIQWLIENTEYYFNPVELDSLMKKEVFYPEKLLVTIWIKKISAADEEFHEVYHVEAIPNYVKPVIHARVIEMNQLKFNEQAE
jgi:hypothetical protein